MKAVSKIFTGAALAALVAVPFAAPADAQYRYRDRDHSVAGDIMTGVAILGGIAAVTSAMDRDGLSYGYGYRDRYRSDYTNAVQACGYQAERYGRGRIQITDVDRRGYNSYRVRGVIDSGDYGYGGGYDRYGRSNGYGGGYDRYSRGNSYGGGYDRYGRNGYGRGGYERTSFACTARANGRVTDFDINRF